MSPLSGRYYVPAKYYFAASGSDGGAGTMGSPWATKAKFNGLALNAGDSVFFNGGDRFAGPFYVIRSGSAGNQIVITSYGTGQAILEGFESLTGWTTVGGSIMQATCNTCQTSVNIVRRYGKNERMGRTPNYNPTDGGFWKMSAGTITTVLSSSIPSGSAYVGAEAVVHANNYTFNRSAITGQSAGQFTVNAMPDIPLVNFGTFVQNFAGGLDTTGEWYWNNSTRKLQMVVDSTPTALNAIEASAVDTVVTITGSYNTLKNITIEGANKLNVSFPANVAYDTIANCNIQFAGINDIDVSQLNSAIISHCGFMYNNIVRANNNGFSVVYPAQVNDSWIDMSRIGLNALFAGAGQSGGATYGNVQWYGLRDSITRTLFDSSGGPGWAQYGGDTCYFHFDRFTYNGLVTADVGAFYFSVHSGVLNTVDHCFADNCLGNFQGTDQPVSIYGTGFYQDSRATNVKFQNCLAFNNTYTGMNLHMARLSNIDSLTSVFNTTSQLYLQEDIDTAFANTVTNSIFVSNDSASLVVAWYLQGRNNLNTCFTGNNFNVYARPKRQTTPFRNNAGGLTYYNLVGFQNLIGQDFASTGSPIRISNDAGMILFYNPTLNDSTVTIPQAYVNARGIRQTAGPYVLHPFTSLVLLPQSKLSVAFRRKW